MENIKIVIGFIIFVIVGIAVYVFLDPSFQGIQATQANNPINLTNAFIALHFGISFIIGIVVGGVFAGYIPSQQQ